LLFVQRICDETLDHQKVSLTEKPPRSLVRIYGIKYHYSKN